MSQTVNLDELDRLLDELEGLASNLDSDQEFYEATLARFQYLLGAQGCALVVNAGLANWVPFAVRGNLSMLWLKEALDESEASQSRILAGNMRGLGVPTSPGCWEAGALAVEFSQPIEAAEVDSLSNLCEAFAEVILRRQTLGLASVTQAKWIRFQESIASLSEAKPWPEFCCQFVNDTAVLVGADRVSMVANRGRRSAHVLSVSGLATVSQKSEAVEAIAGAGNRALEERAAFLQQARPRTGVDEPELPAGLLQNYVAIPFLDRRKTSAPPKYALVMEWANHERCLAGLRSLNYLVPSLAACWTYTERWRRIPYILRAYVGGNAWLASNVLWRSARILAYAAVLCLAYFLLSLPTPLLIQADGTLQAADQRVVFAPLDGTVRKILVTDRQKVSVEDPLLTMDSPMLDIDIQNLEGQIRANAEKRDGLNVQINQYSLENSDVLAQSRWASEVKELEAELSALKERKAALLRERQKLKIRAPIDGVIVSHKIEELLDSRPLRRGDPLLRIARYGGPWRLELQIADRDSGLVKEHIFGESNPRPIEFVFAARPEVDLQAQPSWISPSARNPDGLGSIVDLHADVGEDVVRLGHAGATVYAKLDCGSRPFWYVWSRPLVEFIQRTFWY